MLPCDNAQQHVQLVKLRSAITASSRPTKTARCSTVLLAVAAASLGCGRGVDAARSDLSADVAHKASMTVRRSSCSSIRAASARDMPEGDRAAILPRHAGLRAVTAAVARRRTLEPDLRADGPTSADLESPS